MESDIVVLYNSVRARAEIYGFTVELAAGVYVLTRPGFSDWSFTQLDSMDCFITGWQQCWVYHRKEKADGQ